jgi:hypothetical protein
MVKIRFVQQYFAATSVKAASIIHHTMFDRILA